MTGFPPLAPTAFASGPPQEAPVPKEFICPLASFGWINTQDVTASKMLRAPVSGAATLSVPMPMVGRIAALTVGATEARTAGSLTVEAYVNDSATGIRTTLDATNTQTSFVVANQPGGFGANDFIDVRITISSWTPSSADIEATLWLALVFPKGGPK